MGILGGGGGKKFMLKRFYVLFRSPSQDVPDLEKLYARKLWADFSFPSWVGETAVIPSQRLQVWVLLFLSSWYYSGAREPPQF